MSRFIWVAPARDRAHVPVARVGFAVAVVLEATGDMLTQLELAVGRAQAAVGGAADIVVDTAIALQEQSEARAVGVGDWTNS